MVRNENTSDATSPILQPYQFTTQRRTFSDLPFCIQNAIMDINRILNYASSARSIILYGKQGTGKTLIIEQLAAHINELPCMHKKNISPQREVRTLSVGQSVILRDDDTRANGFITRLNAMNADRHLIIFCDDMKTADFIMRSCPTTSVIMEMSEDKIEALSKFNGELLEKFEPVHIDADMQWKEALHEIQEANKRFTCEYSLDKMKMSNEAIKSFAWSLMRAIYPSRESAPDPHEHIGVPIGYIIQQIEYAYARALEKPYCGKRITPLMASRIAYESYCNTPYIDDDVINDTVDIVDNAPLASSPPNGAGEGQHPAGKLKIKKMLGYKDPAKLATRIKHHIIDQDKAVDMIAQSIMIDAAKLKPKNKPVASFLFIGPSGVGKTQVAKVLAGEMLDKPAHFIRIDCSELSQKHMALRLFGSPPGYVGYNKGGELTNAVREHPQSVILLDEVEKAHRDIWDTFLQAFDDARMTDGRGVTTDFSHCVFIMTSNVGSVQAHQRSAGFGTMSDSGNEHSYLDAMKDYFKPEFINRLDGICVFNELTTDDYKRIVNLKLKTMEDIINTNYNMNVAMEISPNALSRILDDGSIQSQGARGFDKTLQKMIALPLAKMIMAKDIDMHGAECISIDTNKDIIDIGVKQRKENGGK